MMKSERERERVEVEEGCSNERVNGMPHVINADFSQSITSIRIHLFIYLIFVVNFEIPYRLLNSMSALKQPTVRL